MWLNSALHSVEGAQCVLQDPLGSGDLFTPGHAVPCYRFSARVKAGAQPLRLRRVLG